ncbi:unnamed protein product [Discosporangium mesarthrocarpum]
MRSRWDFHVPLKTFVTTIMLLCSISHSRCFVAPAVVVSQDCRLACQLSQCRLKAAEGYRADDVVISTSGLSPDRRWITDPWDRGVLFSVNVGEVVHDIRSAFQHVQVFETPAMGRLLVLDGALQCAERDEAGYHEFIAHVPLCREGGASTSGKRVVIIGGGDGGAAREILRHQDVSTVDLVDIDAEVMRASKEFIPGIWKHPDSTEGNHIPLDEDARLTVWAEDGLAFLADESREGYDLIVVDASDPVGPGAALYSDDFYALLRRRLRPKGAVAVQGGSFWYLPKVFRTVYHGLLKAFPRVLPLQCFTAVYPGGLWNLQVATLGDDPSKVDRAKARTLCERYNLSFYSPEAHHASFALPPVAHSELAKPPPTLGETAADLEEIMAYGEGSVGEEGGKAIEWSARWEPEVRRSLNRLVAGKSTNPSEEGGASRSGGPLAAFDADGTLWGGDCAELFMSWMQSQGQWAQHGDFIQSYKNLLEKGQKKEAYGYVAQLFAGMSLDLVSQLTEQCFAEKVKPLIIPEVAELVRTLLSRGWRVCIVTASPRWIVEPGARWLGVSSSDVIGVEVGRRFEGREMVTHPPHLFHPGCTTVAARSTLYRRFLFSFLRSVLRSGLGPGIIKFMPVALCPGRTQALTRRVCMPLYTSLGWTQVDVTSGLASSKVREPIPVGEGKVIALKEAFGAGPSLAAGNSRDDFPMLSFARGLALLVNPESTDPDPQGIEDAARKNGWSVHHI